MNFIKIKRFWREVGRNAYLDWSIIIVFFAIITLFLMSVGIKIYLDIENGQFGVGSKRQQVTIREFNIKSFDVLIKRLEEKDQNRSKVNEISSRLRDPSI